jgi:hypothetical protein
VRARVEALLADASTWSGGKQRLTATRLHRMLIEAVWSAASAS